MAWYIKFSIVFGFGLMIVHQQANGQIYKFNCFQQAAYTYNFTGDTVWTDTSYLVTIDFEKKKVTMRNKAAWFFDVTGYDPLRKEVNGNTIIINATDKQGNICNLELTLFHERSFHVATLVIRYPHIMYACRLRKPKTSKRSASLRFMKQNNVHLQTNHARATGHSCDSTSAHFSNADSDLVAHSKKFLLDFQGI